MRDPTFFRRKAGRRDANHASIRDGLRKLGHFVVDTAGVGGGVPDLLVWPRVDWSRPTSTARHLQLLMDGATPVWLELKVAKGSLRKSQTDWRMSATLHGLRVATVGTLDEALEALK